MADELKSSTRMDEDRPDAASADGSEDEHEQEEEALEGAPVDDAGGASIAAVPRFTHGREWWNASDMQRAMQLAGEAAGAGATFRDVELPTGPGFWLDFMARFPQLRNINLRRLTGHFHLVDGEKVVKLHPGGGEDIVLQTFEWNEQVVGAQFTRTWMQREKTQVCTTTFKCNGDACHQGYVLVCEFVCLCFVCVFFQGLAWRFGLTCF